MVIAAPAAPCGPNPRYSTFRKMGQVPWRLRAGDPVLFVDSMGAVTLAWLRSTSKRNPAGFFRVNYYAEWGPNQYRISWDTIMARRDTRGWTVWLRHVER